MTIVVGYSPSGQGRAALRAALRYAERSGEDLAIASHQYNDAATGMTAATEAEVRAELAEAGARCGDVTVHSSPEREIGEFVLAVAEEVGASLVVIGLRRKPPIGKLNLGASARRVVLGASCPVLAVKDDPADLSRRAATAS
ncbi:universal stress protein [Brachybacterium saurashtrense]|uniref:Universal stress protein n=1 Tax=Brachybacterium saurashtrense TaxID=556288 RepID=A0A345YM20_9MICO|nr:universal stress protein [Brachybacterium saurashtrense]AXK44972.1 universal stress protein [Brachybacterium saurashtrense]RRR21656.1 universal stress protein [Brachybacterium saurashtrense]